MRIDDKTVIPIGWVISCCTVLVVSAVAGTFWVSSVNDRLSRIEDKLGIPPYRTAVIPVIREAHAK